MQAGLKWPNDVLLPPRPGESADGPHGAGKVAGLLAEVSGEAVVLGIGLNVTTSREELPAAAPRCARPARRRPTATRSCAPSCASSPRGWRRGRTPTATPSPAGWPPPPARSASPWACTVRVERQGGGPEGVAEGIDDDGRLLVRTRAGRLEAVAAGDVVHLRDADEGSS